MIELFDWWYRASASVDQTMATWGGSTVDNMESITEDGAAQDNDEDEDEDDGKYSCCLYF